MRNLKAALVAAFFMAGGPALAQSYPAATTNRSVGTGTGGAGTYTLSSSVGTFTAQTMYSSNMNSCVYYLASGSPNAQAGCTSSPFNGVFSDAELTGNGFQLMLASGCSAYFNSGAGTTQTVGSPPSTTCNVGTSAGNWAFKIKQVEVWQTSPSDKIVN